MRGGLVSIGIASAVIAVALLALVYRGGSAGPEPPWVLWLPFVNAGFNSLSATCIVCGVAAIRRREREVHRRWMLAAVASSALFLVSYVTYHAIHGDSSFLGQGAIRPIYFFVLITHIVLSVIALPLVLSTIYLSLSGRFPQHRRLARWTFPIWLYVSVTGVVVFAFLQIWGSTRA